jgi:multidrug efflux system membrane fusion protein
MMDTRDTNTTVVAENSAHNSSFGSKIKKHWILSSVIVVVALLCVWLLVRVFSKPKAKPAGPQPIPVALTPVKVGNIDVYIDALGTVTPVYTVTVVSRVAGEITEVRFKEGQNVKKNDLLAVIDPRPYVAALLQAQGQLSRDEAALKNARIDLVRYQNSYKEHAIPEQQLATQQATVDQDEGTVKVDQGNLAAAQVNVDYTRIVSPIDGRVGLRNIDPGNVVPANGTAGLCVLTQLQPITVIFTVAEDDLGDVTEAMATGRTMAVQALDRAKTHQIATGALLTVDNQVNTTTGTVRARATFANARNELFPNQFVNARLLVKTLTQVNLVPQAAIQRNNDVAFVYLEKPDSTVQSVNVTILATEAGVSAITGVKAGDQLVTDGFDKLQNGSKIVQRKPAAEATPPAGGKAPAQGKAPAEANATAKTPG